MSLPMARVALNIAVFVLAFLVGYMPTLVPPTGDHDASEALTYEVTLESDTKHDDVFKYGCRNEEAVSFWEKLDKEQFLRQQRAQLDKSDAQRAKDRFADFERTFGCSHFLGVDREDLNNDGVDELKVQAEGGMRDWPTYVFQQTDSGLRMILAEAWTFEEEPATTTTHDFRDLVYFTNYSGGYREITHYQFDGKTYVPTKCFSEDHFVNRNGDHIPVDTPIAKRISCRDRSRVQ